MFGRDDPEVNSIRQHIRYLNYSCKQLTQELGTGGGGVDKEEEKEKMVAKRKKSKMKIVLFCCINKYTSKYFQCVNDSGDPSVLEDRERGRERA